MKPDATAPRGTEARYRYDMGWTEHFIGVVGERTGEPLSRDAQHLLNEALWLADWSPETFCRAGPPARMAVIHAALPRVRDEAREAFGEVVNATYAALRSAGLH